VCAARLGEGVQNSRLDFSRTTLNRANRTVSAGIYSSGPRTHEGSEWIATSWFVRVRVTGRHSS
jgi:hypothetical protein